MRRITAIALGVLAIGLGGVENSEARDGCGRGRFFNGYACVREYYEQPQIYAPAPQYYGEPRNYGQPGYYGRNRAPSRDPNAVCPPRWTMQGGQCKPYTGR